jgi:hypothetical protein
MFAGELVELAPSFVDGLLAAIAITRCVVVEKGALAVIGAVLATAL